MITRAQAEALLTLAESLEACERLDVHVAVPGRGEVLLIWGPYAENFDLNVSDALSPVELRLLIDRLMPKSET